MIDDFAAGQAPRRKKPKHIEPLPKPARKPLHTLAVAEDPTFKTPEQIADTEAPSTDEPTVVRHEDPNAPKKWYKLDWPLTRRQQIISGALALVVAFGIGAGWTLTHHKRTVAAVDKPTKSHSAAKQVIYSKLSGLPVSDAGVNQRPVTGVMIENSLDARPQSGLSQAGVVFEAVAEGGVTRFLALYQDQQPTNVGPIRSARPYYVAWDMGFDASYAHVGGSDDALADIKSWGTKDLNQFYNGDSYHRVSSRAAPHNVYTGIDTLTQLEGNKGYGASQFNGFARKSDKPYKAPAAPTATTAKKPTPSDTRTPVTSLDFSLSGYTYDPHYDYDASSNSYKRTEAGEAHTDANSGAQLSPKVVIAIVVPENQGALDSSGAYYSNYNVIGSGQAYVFQDGTVTVAQWNKPDNATNIQFRDSNGKPLGLNRGQTWITAVTGTDRVTYK